MTWKGCLAALVLTSSVVSPAWADPMADMLKSLSQTETFKEAQALRKVSEGKAAFYGGDYDRAQTSFDEALGIAPALPEAHLGLAQVARVRGDKALAAVEFDKAIAGHTARVDKSPKLAGHYVDRALARQAAGDVEGARADAAKALTIAPDWVENQLGHAGDRFKADPYAAIGYLDRALVVKPDSFPALANRGIAWRRIGALDRAAADLEAALAMSPDHPLVLYNRGLIRVAAGQTTEGQADIAKARQMDPKLPAPGEGAP